MVKDLDQEVDLLRNQASDNTKDIKKVEQTCQWVKTYLNHLSSTKADKTDVETNKKDIDGKVNFCFLYYVTLACFLFCFC